MAEIILDRSESHELKTWMQKAANSRAAAIEMDKVADADEAVLSRVHQRLEQHHSINLADYEIKPGSDPQTLKLVLIEKDSK